jgi:hypothetical protein
MPQMSSDDLARQQQTIRPKLSFVSLYCAPELHTTLLQSLTIETHTQGPDHLPPSLSAPD